MNSELLNETNNLYVNDGKARREYIKYLNEGGKNVEYIQTKSKQGGVTACIEPDTLRRVSEEVGARVSATENARFDGKLDIVGNFHFGLDLATGFIHFYTVKSADDFDLKVLDGDSFRSVSKENKDLMYASNHYAMDCFMRIFNAVVDVKYAKYIKKEKRYISFVEQILKEKLDAETKRKFLTRCRSDSDIVDIVCLPGIGSVVVPFSAGVLIPKDGCEVESAYIKQRAFGLKMDDWPLAEINCYNSSSFFAPEDFSESYTARYDLRKDDEDFSKRIFNGFYCLQTDNLQRFENTRKAKDVLEVDVKDLLKENGFKCLSGPNDMIFGCKRDILKNNTEQNVPSGTDFAAGDIDMVILKSYVSNGERTVRLSLAEGKSTWKKDLEYTQRNMYALWNHILMESHRLGVSVTDMFGNKLEAGRVNERGAVVLFNSGTAEVHDISDQIGWKNSDVPDRRASGTSADVPEWNPPNTLSKMNVYSTSYSKDEKKVLLARRSFFVDFVRKVFPDNFINCFKQVKDFFGEREASSASTDVLECKASSASVDALDGKKILPVQASVFLER